MDAAWAFEHSVECSVPMGFAWRFWTDVRNWALDDDVQSVELDGPFAEGARGVTNSRSSGRIEWRITSVQPGRAVMEIPLPGAIVRFDWTFEAVQPNTRMTQRVSLSGESAPTYMGAMESLQTGVPAGMRRLCHVMEEAFRLAAE